MWQIHLRIELAETVAELCLKFAGFEAERELPVFHNAAWRSRVFIYVYVIMLKMSVAYVVVLYERGDEIQVMRPQFMLAAGKTYGGSPGCDKIDACERTAHACPVPVGVMYGMSDVECKKFQIVDRYSH